ncbi:MAG: NUDIX hydrolase [Bradymonadaceae bacterium]
MSGEPFGPERVRERLRQLGSAPRHRFRDLPNMEGVEFTDAAVLIPLTQIEDEIHVVFTRRSHDMREHSGEVSFPGGRADACDETLVHTALRESHEEIQLEPSAVNIYGALVQMPTITGYSVTTFVGEFAQPYELVANPEEISTIFSVSLQALADETIHRIEEREYAGIVYPLHFYEVEGHVIWGATGYMVHLFLDYLTS